jgi:phage terminase Nu1 subunit (DNA packaging protein)
MPRKSPRSGTHAGNEKREQQIEARAEFPEFDERLLLPKKLMAQAFGISVQAFDKWKVRPHGRDGREVLFFLPDVIAYRLEREAKEEGQLDLRAETARLNKARADHEELKVAQFEGRVLPADLVAEVWTGMLLACRAKILPMPTKLALQLSMESDPVQVEAVLREECDAALEELSEYDPKQYRPDSPDRAGGDEEDRTSAADSSQ